MNSSSKNHANFRIHFNHEKERKKKVMQKKLKNRLEKNEDHQEYASCIVQYTPKQIIGEEEPSEKDLPPQTSLTRFIPSLIFK